MSQQREPEEATVWTKTADMDAREQSQVAERQRPRQEQWAQELQGRLS